jgi:hypothetical protein
MTVHRLRPDDGMWFDAAFPAAAAAELRAGGIVELSGRASAQSGSKTLRLAVQNVYTAAEHLARQGCHLQHLLPPEDELQARVLSMATRVQSTSRSTGKTFVNHHYLYTDALDRGLLVLVQYGTGTQLGEDFQQPAIEGVRATVETYEPVLLFLNEIRSWGRSGPALAPLLLQLRDVSRRRGRPVYIGDATRRVQPLTKPVELELLSDGYRAEQEAEDTARRTGDAIRHQSVGGPVSGAFPIAVTASLPPPMATAYLKSAFGAPKRHAFLDTPGARPDDNRVAYGLPQVYRTSHPTSSRTNTNARLKPDPDPDPGHDPDPHHTPGRALVPVDQVAVLRRFYEVFLTDDWSVTKTGELMADLGFSSESLRRRPRRGGPSAEATVRSDHRGGDASKICHLIWSHRHFHQTGDLIVRVPGGEVTYEVEMPDGRPIATRDQIARITAAKARLASLRPRARVYLLTGLPATLNGQPAVLEPENRRAEGLQWMFRIDGPPVATARAHGGRATSDAPASRPGRAAATAAGGRRRAPTVPLPHTVWVSAVVRSMVEGEVLPVLRPSRHQERELLQAAVDKAVLELKDAKQHHEAALEHAQKPELRGNTLQAAVDAEEAADLEVCRKQTKVRLAENALRQEHAREAPPSLDLADFLDWCVALRDPADPRLRRVLQHSIVDFEAESTRTIRQAQLTEQQITFRHGLRVRDDDGQVWEVRVEGQHRLGSALQTGARVYAALQAMHAGVPLRQTFGAGWRDWMPLARQALTGTPAAGSVLVNVTDPRLLRLGMAICHPLLPEPDWDACGHPTTPETMPRMTSPPLTQRQRARRARDLGESPALLHRLADLYGTRHGRKIGAWLPSPSPVLARLVDQAAKPVHVGTLSALPPAARDGLLEISRRPGTNTRAAEGSTSGASGDVWVQVPACHWCGSRRRMVLGLREPVGLVCRACRRDDAGEIWPARPYGRYGFR